METDKYGIRWGRRRGRFFHEDPLGIVCCAGVLVLLLEFKLDSRFSKLCRPYRQRMDEAGMGDEMQHFDFSRSTLDVDGLVAVIFFAAAALQLLLPCYPVRVHLSSWRRGD